MGWMLSCFWQETKRMQIIAEKKKLIVFIKMFKLKNELEGLVKPTESALRNLLIPLNTLPVKELNSS